MEINVLKQIWPEWQVEEKPLGKGSYGVVYKAVRRDHNVESYAAIKVISIPTDPSEVDSLHSEGLDMNATRTYLQGIVKDFVSEIQLMESLKGVQNIVSVEDYKVVEKADEVGWDIYIRMELLTPFDKYKCDKSITEEDIIKLGCDICTALEICGKRNIIHRDIKPANIFVNDFGDFKLGDFGIARKLENMSGGLSQKGTPDYMAPEVANNSDYDSRVDIYSLGIVLYRLLNCNRPPFLDTEKQLLSPSERKIAWDRRIRGEQLPAPCEASPAMADLLLRACAYDPNMRFASATEMKQALMSVANGTYQMLAVNDLDKTKSVRKATDSYDKTRSVRKAPATNYQSGQVVGSFGNKPSKKSNLPKIIPAVLAVIVLVGVGIFAVPKIIDNDETAITSDNTGSENGQYSKGDEEQIANIIADAEALATKEDYEGALTKVKAGLVTYPKSEELQNKSDEYTTMLNTQIKEKALDDADTLVKSGDYLAAIQTIEAATNTIGEDAELNAKAKEYENSYVSETVEQANTFVENKDFDAADKLLETALGKFPDNTILKQKIQEIDECRPKYLLDVIAPYEKPYHYEDHNTVPFSMGGQSFTHGFTCMGYGDRNLGNLTYFNLGGKYTELSFTAGIVDEHAPVNGETIVFSVAIDGNVVDSFEMKEGDLPVDRTITIPQGNQLVFSVYSNQGTAFYDGNYGIANITVN